MVKLTNTDKLDEKLSGEVWAISLSPNGNLLAATTYDGRINIWNTSEMGTKLRHYETKGSFGMCIEIVRFPLVSHTYAAYARIVCGWETRRFRA